MYYYIPTTPECCKDGEEKPTELQSLVHFNRRYHLKFSSISIRRFPKAPTLGVKGVPLPPHFPISFPKQVGQ